MKISALQSLSVSGQQASANGSMAKFKKNFEAIGAALDAGDLTAAKKAYAQLQSDAPSKTDGKDPMGEMMDALGKAIDSGDLDAAQKQYAKIKEEMSKNPPPGGQGNGSRGAKGGAPAGGSSSEKTYDVRDTNKDGTVSAMEQLAYDMKQEAAAINTTSQTSAQTSSSSANNSVGESIDLQA
jgi:hypothetical protein